MTRVFTALCKSVFWGAVSDTDGLEAAQIKIVFCYEHYDKGLKFTFHGESKI